MRLEGETAMPRRFSSFLIRWWRSDDAERLELEHIQTGHKQRAASIEDAVAWLSAQQAAPAITESDERAEPDSSSTDQTPESEG
jgi:hypothetical protein